jgi:hypothetical protein
MLRRLYSVLCTLCSVLRAPCSVLRAPYLVLLTPCIATRPAKRCPYNPTPLPTTTALLQILQNTILSACPLLTTKHEMNLSRSQVGWGKRSDDPPIHFAPIRGSIFSSFYRKLTGELGRLLRPKGPSLSQPRPAAWARLPSPIRQPCKGRHRRSILAKCRPSKALRIGKEMRVAFRSAKAAYFSPRSDAVGDAAERLTQRQLLDAATDDGAGIALRVRGDRMNRARLNRFDPFSVMSYHHDMNQEARRLRRANRKLRSAICHRANEVGDCPGMGKQIAANSEKKFGDQ